MKQLAFALALLATASTMAAAQTRTRVAYSPQVVVQIAVTDLDRAIRFYVDTLDFTLSERRDDLGFAHIQTHVPGLELGLSVTTAAARNGASVINISVTGVPAARALLESRGVTFSGATQTIPGKVSLAGFADPDGNRLRLAGPPIAQ
ncbi:MAG: VOC family protein [Acidobacteriota bacterium]|nr:VOC family protein [Acidobacteriota bacterium]